MSAIIDHVLCDIHGQEMGHFERQRPEGAFLIGVDAGFMCHISGCNRVFTTKGYADLVNDEFVNVRQVPVCDCGHEKTAMFFQKHGDVIRQVCPTCGATATGHLTK